VEPGVVDELDDHVTAPQKKAFECPSIPCRRTRPLTGQSRTSAWNEPLKANMLPNAARTPAMITVDGPRAVSRTVLVRAEADRWKPIH
jgi:hypothetical protein